MKISLEVTGEHDLDDLKYMADEALGEIALRIYRQRSAKSIRGHVYTEIGDIAGAWKIEFPPKPKKPKKPKK